MSFRSRSCSCSSPFDCIYRFVSLSCRTGYFPLSLHVVLVLVLVAVVVVLLLHPTLVPSTPTGMVTPSLDRGIDIQWIRTHLSHKPLV